MTGQHRKARKSQISEEAETRSEKCREELRQIFRIAFQEGAEWADNNPSQNPYDLLSTKTVRIERDTDGKMSDKVTKILSGLPAGMGVIAKRRNDDKIHFLDPETNGENGYAILNDMPDFEEIKIVYIA